jgi:hypothetical protein
MVKEAAGLCSAKGLSSAKVVLIFPNLRYREELCRNPMAPLRFIGNLHWPGGSDAWEALQSRRLHMLPFPTLVLRDFGEDDDGPASWKGIVRLPSWKGFAAFAELSSDGWEPGRGCLPEGDFTLEVEAAKGQDLPGPEQARAYELLIGTAPALRDGILDVLFKAYPEWRTNYLRGGAPPETMPEVTAPSELLKLIRPSSLTVLTATNDGVADIRVGFDCKWDEEHGFAALIHRGKEIEVGDVDLGI